MLTSTLGLNARFRGNVTALCLNPAALALYPTAIESDRSRSKVTDPEPDPIPTGIGLEVGSERRRGVAYICGMPPFNCSLANC